jgi:hypothetical protein
MITDYSSVFYISLSGVSNNTKLQTFIMGDGQPFSKTLTALLLD